jgi:hypothetical protein
MTAASCDSAFEKEGDAMSRTCVIASPFGCTWIEHGSEGHVGGNGYALCVRVPHQPRLVSEMECAHCALWEASTNPDAASTAERRPLPREAGQGRMQGS